MYNLIISVTVSIDDCTDFEDWPVLERRFDLAFQSLLSLATSYGFSHHNKGIGTYRVDSRAGELFGLRIHECQIDFSRRLEYQENLFHFVQLFQSATHLVPSVPQFHSAVCSFSFSSD